MTSSKKQNTRPISSDRNPISGHEIIDDRSKELLERTAEEIVSQVKQTVRRICDGLVSEAAEGVETELTFGLTKEIIYNCLCNLAKDPLVAKSGKFKQALNHLEGSISSHLFTALYDEPAAGAQFEYFDTIFKSEYQQMQKEIQPDVEAQENDEVGPTMNQVERIVDTWIAPHLPDSRPREEVTTLLEDLFKSVTLKLSKAVLS
ncbi:MAG: hypothetical protein GXO58_06590 [Thermodesulfobacteria bacterium]|nr:hypothetical protein [Thermodesulfobacteriota bacterium]